MRLNSNRTIWGAAILSLFATTACGTAEITMETDPDFEGVFDFEGAALTDLSGQCDFATGTVTLGLEAGDIAVMARNSAGLVTINGIQCGDATVSNTRQIVVEESSAGAQTLVLDFLTGQFANGRSGGPGWDIDLGGGTDNLRVRGTAGADRYMAGANGLATNTDANIDVAYAGIESLVISLGPGNDSFSGAGGTTATGTALTSSISVFGGAGNDTLRGGAGADTLSGGEGNDIFSSGTDPDGADTFNGGVGTDTVDYSARTASVTVTIDGVANDGAVGEQDNVAIDVENVTGGLGNDMITGGAGDNVLTGGAGNDTLAGGLGADTLNGGVGDDTFNCGTSTDGADIMAGGTGIDLADYSSRTASVTVNLNGQADDGEQGETDNVRADVENVYGSSVGDVIVGSASANILEGRGGNDTISGGAGNDVLRGGAGNDTLNGDAGDDIFDEGNAPTGGDIMNGGAGVDEVDYSARTASVSVSLGAGANDGGAGEGDDVGVTVENIFGGDGDDLLVGSALDNVINGGLGADTIQGLAGNDTLSGGAGVDNIDGGDGEDAIDGDAGNDTLSCGAGDGDVCLDSADCAAATLCEL